MDETGSWDDSRHCNSKYAAKYTEYHRFGVVCVSVLLNGAWYLDDQQGRNDYTDEYI